MHGSLTLNPRASALAGQAFRSVARSRDRTHLYVSPHICKPACTPLGTLTNVRVGLCRRHPTAGQAKGVRLRLCRARTVTPAV